MMLQILPFGLAGMIICLLITRSLIIYLKQYNIVDAPDVRRLHKRITPRGGGIAIVISFTSMFCFADYYYQNNYSQVVIPPLLLISAISLYDDIKHVSISIRLLVHILTSAWLLYFFLLPHSLLHDELTPIVDFTLAVILFTGFINIYNFMDGIDALTALQSIHLCLGILCLCYLRYDIIIAVDLIIIVATLTLFNALAFLIYNWNPAKIFLGDVGSIFLGVLIGLCLFLLAASSKRLLVASIILSLYYLADGGGTLLIRMVRQEKFWLPHLTHFFQQALQSGRTPRGIVLEIIMGNYWLLLLAIGSLYFPVVSLLLAFFVVGRVLAKFFKQEVFYFDSKV